MKTVLAVASIALVLGIVARPVPSDAANATAPQTNVDHTNDAGNDTGNSKVGALNNGQLDANQKPAPTTAAPAAPKQ